MSYIVIARRWRPQQFDEIIGQEHVSKTISNAIAHQRIAHSYIFTGPRGVGKTSTARILAKAVNCEKGPTPTPCNECPSCQSINKGNSMDVLEIDGASNRGIDEIRNLRENIRFSPTLGKYRIYIIDEVHMLTKEAFNALLKTLEEPPSHALFIFATTEIHRVPATILSRCQRFDFKRIPLKTIMEHLKHICELDNITVEDEALLQIAKKADGSMRDSQSVLDQIISFSGDKITFEHVSQALGVINLDMFFEVTEHIRNRNLKDLIILTKEIISSGYDLNEFLLGLEEHFRNILIAGTMGSTELLDVSENFLVRYSDAAKVVNENDALGYLQIVSETLNTIKWSQQPQLKFELGLIKMAKMPSSLRIEEILEKLELLKKKARNEVTFESTPTINTGSEKPQDNPPAQKPAEMIDVVKEKWQQIIDAVHAKKPSLATAFESFEISEIKNDTIILCFINSNPFHLSTIEKNKIFIEKTISKIVRSNLNIEIEAPEEMEHNEPNQVKTEQNRDNDKLKKFNEIKTNDELISKLIQELDLELI
ncbi:MAG: DNA polymerase III subunit gamma/tau [Calditrichaceae bacterium]